MYFAPQRRALFRHLNFQKWSGAVVFCTFWLGNLLRATTACTFSTSQLSKVVRSCTFWLRNVLRATTACTFSTPQLRKVVRSWGVLYILTSKCASHHNSVHFFDTATSRSGPELRCFVHFDFQVCFAPQRRAIFYLSSGQMAPHPPLERAYLSTLRSHKSLEKTLFRDFPTFSRTWIFFLLRLSLSSSLLWLFPSLVFIHIVGSLTSKLPSIMYIYIYIGLWCYICYVYWWTHLYVVYTCWF